MKPLLCLVALGTLLPSFARAEWRDLQVGMDQRAAVKCVGTPLLRTKSRGRQQIWTYDRCGYIEFANGVVAYWEAPKRPVPVSAKPNENVVKTKPKTSPAGSLAAAW